MTIIKRNGGQIHAPGQAPMKFENHILTVDFKMLGGVFNGQKSINSMLEALSRSNVTARQDIDDCVTTVSDFDERLTRLEAAIGRAVGEHNAREAKLEAERKPNWFMRWVQDMAR